MSVIKYLSAETADLFRYADKNEVKIELLWGDRIEVLPVPESNGRVKVKARGITGYVKASLLGDDPLLELYFIDVGQGDGILIVTPDRKHILIDGGYYRSAQPHGKSAADFVDWKFKKDYGENTIRLDAMIASHCDADHYGGLWDLLNPKEMDELDCSRTELANFYHAGISWWKKGASGRFIGNKKDGYMLDLLEDRASIAAGMNTASEMRLQGYWAQFMQCILDSGAFVKRLAFNPDRGFEYLPGFEDDKPVKFKILGPIEQTIDGKARLKDFGSESQTSNGNSILLRVDYGKVKILLTGDLNKKSQHHILEKLTGNLAELSSDVAKSCHHGSDDCSFRFMEALQASGFIISSGDDESHAHPRPNIVAACGVTGNKKFKDDELLTPLIYSTEISRSYKLGDPYKIEYLDFPLGEEKINLSLDDEKKTNISFKRTSSGGLRASDKTKPMDRIMVVDSIVYGLVNVRTNGSKILCATLNEGKGVWEVQTFDTRF